MKKRLKDIAGIFSGVYLKPNPEGDIYYIQAKNFNKGEFHSAEPDLKFNIGIHQYLLRPGDVLLAIKGNNNFAFHYDGTPGKAIASSTFIVIRIWDQDNLLPEFFSWYLNHPQTQLFFKDQSRGTDILSITIRLVKEIDVFIPSVAKQKIILELDKLRKKEKELRQKIERLRDDGVQQQLLQVIKL